MVFKQTPCGSLKIHCILFGAQFRVGYGSRRAILNRNFPYFKTEFNFISEEQRILRDGGRSLCIRFQSFRAFTRDFNTF